MTREQAIKINMVVGELIDIIQDQLQPARHGLGIDLRSLPPDKLDVWFDAVKKRNHVSELLLRAINKD